MGQCCLMIFSYNFYLLAPSNIMYRKFWNRPKFDLSRFFFFRLFDFFFFKRFFSFFPIFQGDPAAPRIYFAAPLGAAAPSLGIAALEYFFFFFQQQVLNLEVIWKIGSGCSEEYDPGLQICKKV